MTNDVETVLRKIREQVIADNSAIVRSDVMPVESASPELATIANSPNPESLDRLSAQLAVTARSWDRLPPLISNRHGTLSRIEISIKKAFKPLTRWFTWEQINFNAAVHHALLDTLATMRAQRQEQASIRATLNDEIASEIKAWKENVASLNEEIRTAYATTLREHNDLKAQLAEANAVLRRFSEMLSDLAEEMRKGQADVAKEMEKRFPEIASLLEAGLKRLADDFDGRLADLRAEQRVCFKQLSLESSEAAVLEDRGRRALEARLARLENSEPKS